MKRISIFIGFTPYHQFFAQNLIEKSGGDVWCLFTKGWPKTEKKYKKLGLFSFKSKVFSKFLYIVSLVYFSVAVKFLLKNRLIDVYVPHPANIFSNILFFSNKVNSVNIYEDGVLNYYDASSEVVKDNKILLIIARLLGIPYVKYSGHLAGYDTGKVHCLYVSRPKLSVGKNKITKIISVEIPKNKVKCVTGRVLFLDQNTSSVIIHEKRREILLNMFKLYPVDDFCYYYKGHHDFSDPIPGMIEVPSSLKDKPAEEIIESLTPEIVVSFYSSALININNIYSDVMCYYLAAQYLLVEIDGKREALSTIFEEAGVRPLTLGE